MSEHRSEIQDRPDRDCYTLPNGDCVSPMCGLHGPEAASVQGLLDAGWSLVRGVEPGIYEADTSADGYYLTAYFGRDEESNHGT